MKGQYLLFAFLLGCSKDHLPDPPKHTIVVDFPCINVKDCGAIGDGQADETAAFAIAMDSANSSKLPIYIPRGVYKTHLKLRHDGLHIIGETNPGASVSDGSIILGLIDCNFKKNVIVESLGIDSRGQLGPTDDAALTSGAIGANDILNQQFKNISIIGDGFFNYKHGILCFAGTGINIRNVTVSYFYHGIAIRSSNVTIDSVYANYCGFTSVIVKSDLGYNTLTENVSLNHIDVKGDPLNPYNRGGAVMVSSYSANSITQNVSIQNVKSYAGGVACVLVQQKNGTIKNVSITNCTSDGQGDASNRACYDVSGGSQITFFNCNAVNSNGYGFRSTGLVDNIKVINSYESNSKMGSWIGTFKYLQLNGIEIIK